MAKEEKDYAVVDQQGNVINVIVWDGTFYDADTNPQGLMKETFPDCKFIPVSLTPENEGQLAEPGGKYNFLSRKFSRNPNPAKVSDKSIPTTLPPHVANLVQALVDKGVITHEDIANSGGLV